MAFINLFVKLEINQESNYIYFDNFIFETDIEEEYKQSLEISKQFGINTKREVFEGYKNTFVYLEKVKFDGRKKVVTQNDIFNSLVNHGYAVPVDTSNLFPFYSATDKLKIQLDEQLLKRKELVNRGQFVLLNDIA